MSYNTPLIEAPGQISMCLGYLGATGKISVYEKASKIEALTAMMGSEFERANKYNIVDEQGNDLFFAHEQTDCCKRQIKNLLPACTAWNIRFFLTAGGQNTPVFDMTRDWSVTCCCLNRPKAKIHSPDDDSQVMGYVADPCSISPTFKVFNANEEHVMTAAGPCCQLGLFFPMPCGPCARVHFDLTDPDGNVMGEMDKEIPCGLCCCKFLFAQSVDNYHLNVSELSPEMKALAVATAVFIDFSYFSQPEEKDTSDGQQQDDQ